MTSVVWFRRDLRTRDHPALLAADRAGLGLFVLDRRPTSPSGAPRLAFLYRCLRDLDEQLDGRLLVVSGGPVELVPRIAKQIDASSVHVTADFAPYGRQRDENVENALGDIEFIRTGSPYAVSPGRVTKPDGTPCKVFTPFSRAWAAHGRRKPAGTDASTVDCHRDRPGKPAGQACAQAVGARRARLSPADRRPRSRARDRAHPVQRHQDLRASRSLTRLPVRSTAFW
jgi:deoxyribodipyrimidine photo-lyase